MTDIKPLDVLTLNRGDEHDHHPVLVLLRDFRDPPAWIVIEASSGQILRVHDFVARRYRNLGRHASSHGDFRSIAGLSDLLARAVW